MNVLRYWVWRIYGRLGGHANHLYHWSDVRASLTGGPRASCYICGRQAGTFGRTQ